MIHASMLLLLLSILFLVQSSHRAEILDNYLFHDEHKLCINGTNTVPISPVVNYSTECSYMRYQSNDIVLYDALYWIRELQHNAKYNNDDNRVTVSNLNRYRLKAMIKKLKKGHDITVLVVGGSLTAGRQVGGMNGAWPHILQNQWNLNKIDGIGSINVINEAVGGTSSLWLLYRLNSLLHINMQIDLVIIDYDVNDCALISNSEQSREELRSITELVIRKLLLYSSHPALIYMNTAITHKYSKLTPDCNEFYTCYSIGEIRKPILDMYYIPHVSQKMAIWPDFLCPDTDYWPCSKFCSHPGSKAHHFLSNIVYYYLNEMVHNISSISSNSNGIGGDSDGIDSQMMAMERDKLQSLAFVSNYTYQLDQEICVLDTSVINHINSPAMQDNYLSSRMNADRNTHIKDASGLYYKDDCWQYKEDAAAGAGKPGWITDNCTTTPIIFYMKFGIQKEFALNILTTYNDTAGTAMVSISNSLGNSTSSFNSYLKTNKSSIVFHDIDTIDAYNGGGGDNAKGYSIATTFLFKHVEHNLWSQQIRNMPLNEHDITKSSYHLIKIELVNNTKRQQPYKFKIISIIAC